MMMMMMWLEYKTLSFGVGDTAFFNLRTAAHVFASCSTFMYEIFISHFVELSIGLVIERICKSRTSECKFCGKSKVKLTCNYSVISVGMPFEGEFCFLFLKAN